MNTSGVQSASGNCSLLASRTGFADYIQILNATTAFNEELLESCKGEICNALWGDGNADISGIGMVVGYFLASILGFIFTIVLALHRPFRSRDATSYKNLFLDGFKLFFISLVYFSVSIQIACIIVLVRKDFGISANGFGGITVEITWAVALLCMLPLMFPMLMLPILEKSRRSENRSFSDGNPANYRLFLFLGCWLPFFYIFVSQMISDYAPSQIGTGAGGGGTTIITDQEWQDLTNLCLSGIEDLSSSEQTVLSRFGTAGAILIAGYGLLSLLWFIISRIELFEYRSEIIQKKFSATFTEHSINMGKLIFLLTVIPALTIPQVWGVLRLRSIQEALAEATSNAYTDNQWTFGQVIAVMLFVPVGVDMMYRWIHEPKRMKRGLRNAGR